MNQIKVVDNSVEVKNAAKGAIEKALEEIGQVAEGYAKRLCPVDTGRLRNSISHSTDKDSAYIGTNVEYGPFVEMGTRKRRAQPYLKPAATDHSSEYKKIAESAMKSG